MAPDQLLHVVPQTTRLGALNAVVSVIWPNFSPNLRNLTTKLPQIRLFCPKIAPNPFLHAVPQTTCLGATNAAVSVIWPNFPPYSPILPPPKKIPLFCPKMTPNQFLHVVLQTTRHGAWSTAVSVVWLNFYPHYPILTPKCPIFCLKIATNLFLHVVSQPRNVMLSVILPRFPGLPYFDPVLSNIPLFCPKNDPKPIPHVVPQTTQLVARDVVLMLYLTQFYPNFPILPENRSQKWPPNHSRLREVLRQNRLVDYWGLFVKSLNFASS